MNIETKRLENLLKRFKGIIPRKSSRSILENVYFSVQNSILTLAGTDAEQALKIVLPLEAENISFCIDCDVFYHTIATFTKTAFNIELTFDGNYLTISGDNKSRTLKTELVDEFPALPNNIESKNYLNMCRADLLELYKIRFACAKEQTRYALNGVLLERKQNFVNAVATDGRRLAICEMLHVPGDDFSYILPVAFCGCLNNAIQKDDATFSLAFDDDNLSMSWSTEEASYLLQSRFVEGHFPKYQAVIPEKLVSEPESQIFFRNKQAHKEFQDNLKFVLSATSEDEKSCQISLNGRCEFIAKNSERGDTKLDVNLDCRGIVDYNLNPRFLLDGSRWLSNKECEMNFINPDKATVLMGENQKYKYIVMPIQAKD